MDHQDTEPEGEGKTLLKDSPDDSGGEKNSFSRFSSGRCLCRERVWTGVAHARLLAGQRGISPLPALPERHERRRLLSIPPWNKSGQEEESLYLSVKRLFW